MTTGLVKIVLRFFQSNQSTMRSVLAEFQPKSITEPQSIEHCGRLECPQHVPEPHRVLVKVISAKKKIQDNQNMLAFITGLFLWCRLVSITSWYYKKCRGFLWLEKQTELRENRKIMRTFKWITITKKTDHS